MSAVLSIADFHTDELASDRVASEPKLSSPFTVSLETQRGELPFTGRYGAAYNRWWRRAQLLRHADDFCRDQAKVLARYGVRAAAN